MPKKLKYPINGVDGAGTGAPTPKASTVGDGVGGAGTAAPDSEEEEAAEEEVNVPPLQSRLVGFTCEEVDLA